MKLISIRQVITLCVYIVPLTVYLGKVIPKHVQVSAVKNLLKNNFKNSQKEKERRDEEDESVGVNS